MCPCAAHIATCALSPRRHACVVRPSATVGLHASASLRGDWCPCCDGGGAAATTPHPRRATQKGQRAPSESGYEHPSVCSWCEQPKRSEIRITALLLGVFFLSFSANDRPLPQSLCHQHTNKILSCGLVYSHHYTVGVPEHDVCARLCVCGTDVVVLCAGLPAGTEDVTAAAAAWACYPTPRKVRTHPHGAVECRSQRGSGRRARHAER